jgi:uncharacterized repeat protein (TIGR03803 family)
MRGKLKLRVAGTGITQCLLAFLLLSSEVSLAQPKYKILHAFGNGMDGGGLWSSVALGGDGELYGTTSGGGAHNGGIVFRLRVSGDGGWAETILHSFPASYADGGDPQGGVIVGPGGVLLGTTVYGGPKNDGTVFQLRQTITGWKESLIHTGGSWARVTRDGEGNLYGTQETDVFELQPTEHGWVRTVLHNFTGGGDGGGAFSPVILDSSGNLYGTTEGGGAYDGGTVYEIEDTTTGWKEKILHSFAVNYKDGHTPGWGALAMDSARNLYGTTAGGGCCGGVVFKLTPGANGDWRESILYEFKGGALGFEAGAGVVMDKAGNLYGTTINGGTPGCGVLYKLAPSPKDKWKYTVLHTFGYGYDGCQPDANLTLGPDGTLYGTTATGGRYGAGTVFGITP